MMQPSSNAPQRICGMSLERCLEKIERFHGFKAPGLVLGMFLVDRGRRRIGAGVEFDAIVETRHCLPDAVQLFTPCTIGNGWMKILDWDQFALSFYDRRSRKGWRIWLDLEKIKAAPDLHHWFMRTIPKSQLPLEALLPVILRAGASVLSERPIFVTRHYQRNKKNRIVICPKCGETFGAEQDDVCHSCRGNGYYRPGGDSINKAVADAPSLRFQTDGTAVRRIP